MFVDRSYTMFLQVKSISYPIAIDFLMSYAILKYVIIYASSFPLIFRVISCFECKRTAQAIISSFMFYLPFATDIINVCLV